MAQYPWVGLKFDLHMKFEAGNRFAQPRNLLLRCNNSATRSGTDLAVSAFRQELIRTGDERCGGAMSTTWKTKWGARRVRKDPPTIEEALIAAEALTDDIGQRIEIAASLMGVSNDEVKTLAAKQAALSRGRSTLVNGRNRAVVVEYKRPRTFRSGPPLGRR